MSVSPTIVEYRGVKGLVAAELLIDDNEQNTAGTDETPNHGLVYGDVFAIAGVAEVSKEVEQASDAHYYDNMAAIVIDADGADTVTVNASAIPLDVQARLTGQHYDTSKGALVEANGRKKPYFALGYITEDTDGNEVYVWRHKGKIMLGTETHNTQDNSTDANGQSFTYTGVNTIHKFTNNPDDLGQPSGAKALVVNASAGLADISTFFEEVTTIDTLQAVSPGE